MSLLSGLKITANVFMRYRLFTTVMVTMLFLVLIRIPLGTFNYPSFVDALAHFILPAVGAPLITELLIKLRYLPSLNNKSSLFIFVLISISAEVVWEVFEYCIDVTLRWNWQLSNADTMMDLVLSVAGGIVGGYIFLRLYRHKS